MTKIKQFNLDSDILGNQSGMITTKVLEGRGGVTYDPIGGSGTDASANVGLALFSGKRIVLSENGFIRTIADATWGSALQFGQSNTGAFAGTEIYGGNSGVTLKHSTSTKLETNNDGTETTGVHTVAHTNDQRNGMYTNSDGQLVFFRNNYANNQTTLVIDDETGNITASGHLTLTTQPSCLVKKNGNLSAPQNSGFSVTGWTSVHDVGSMFNSSNSRITVPTAGSYIVGAALQASGTTGLHIAILKNDAAIGTDSYLNVIDAGGVAQSICVTANASDYFTVSAYVTGNGLTINANRSKFWVVKVT